MNRALFSASTEVFCTLKTFTMNQILVWSAAIILSTFLTSCEKSTDTPITVTKITPSAAEIGDAILVTGTGFNSLIKQDSAASAAISVFINGVQVTGIILDDTSIQVVIPAGITSGPVCITHEGKHICSSIEFTLLSRSPLSNSYLRATDHPGGTNIGLASVQAGKNIYAGYIDWWKYNILQETWTSASAPTDKVSRAANFTINEKGYLFGGLLNTGTRSNRLQVFDETSNTWSFAAPLLTNARADAIAFVWNNKAYIAGGTDTDAPGANTVSRHLWEYDPASNSWTRKADLLYDLPTDARVFKLGNYFYLPSMSGSFQEYNPATNTWRTVQGSFSFQNGYVISDKDADYAYAITYQVTRISLSPDRSSLVFEFYNSIPAGGYGGNRYLSGGVFQPYGNVLYFGLGQTETTTNSRQWWRYRY